MPWLCFQTSKNGNYFDPKSISRLTPVLNFSKLSELQLYRETVSYDGAEPRKRALRKTIPTITVFIFDNKWPENYYAILIIKQFVKDKYRDYSIRTQN